MVHTNLYIYLLFVSPMSVSSFLPGINWNECSRRYAPCVLRMSKYTLLLKGVAPFFHLTHFAHLPGSKHRFKECLDQLTWGAIEAHMSSYPTRPSTPSEFLFRTGQYGDEQLVEEFKLPRKRKSLLSLRTLDSNVQPNPRCSEKNRLVSLPWYTNLLIQLRILSKSSSARDKIMAFVQGWAQWRRALLPKGQSVGESIWLITLETWISDVRKGFKVGKFIVEIEKARIAHISISDRITRSLEVAMHAVAFCYHVVDNRLFFSRIYYKAKKTVSDDFMVRNGVKKVPGQTEFYRALKTRKNAFSLCRCILAIVCEARHVLHVTYELYMLRNAHPAPLNPREDEAKQSQHFEIDHLVSDRGAVKAEERKLSEKRTFHGLMLMRVLCYFVITSSNAKLLPFGLVLSPAVDGFLSMVGASIAVWKNLPTIVRK